MEINLNSCLIFIKNNHKTFDVEWIKEENNVYHVKYKNYYKEYSFKKNDIFIMKEYKKINHLEVLIYRNGNCLTNITEIYDFGIYVKIIYQNGTKSVYLKIELKFEKNMIENIDIKKGLNYLKDLAKNIKDEDNDFLDKQYMKINSINEKSILVNYLTGTYNKEKKVFKKLIFPFGINLSQEKAVSNALENSMSIIEGPPGTGKTQTILNIIANLIINNKTIAVVSNNNSAIENVFEKLEKENLSFFCAMLGNKKNKENFIKNQNGRYPSFNNIQNDNKTEDLSENIKQIKILLDTKNKLAKLNLELEELKIEKKHFQDFFETNNSSIKNINKVFQKSSKNILSFLSDFEFLQYIRKDLSISFRVKSFFKYGIISQSIYKEPINETILYLQNSFYIIKEKEISSEIKKLEKLLEKYNFEKLLEELKISSMMLFRLYLMKKYDTKHERKIFDKDSLWKNFSSIINEYPVVLSTTHSLRSSTAENYLYDYLIIDESSQVDIVSGSLSLSCAKNIIIVGDLIQLPHIVNSKLNTIIDKIFYNYKLNPFYNYKNNLLLSFSGVFKNIPKTLLKEHYRCHPKIIDFCNKKFYNNELIILTEAGNPHPLTLYKTVEGNHSRGLYNQREIDVIEKEILPEMKGLDIGIISPFREQTNKLNNIFSKESNIEVDTVHKYQGREKDNIIITTVVDRENNFVDNPNLLNVAISRAKNKLYLVVSDREKNRNIKDLVNYIKYNNLEIKESGIYSIFDLLYKNYAPHLVKYLRKMKNESDFKSENLMNIVIDNILIKKDFNHLSKALHMPLYRIIKKLSFLDDDEKRFVLNQNTHVDFIIYSKVTKQLILIIEVDGIKYHENNPSQLKRDNLKDRILEKYNIPIIRFKTNESREEERLILKLNEIIA